jgi:hypothetical protein
MKGYQGRRATFHFALCPWLSSLALSALLVNGAVNRIRTVCLSCTAITSGELHHILSSHTRLKPLLFTHSIRRDSASASLTDFPMKTGTIPARILYEG